MPSPHSADLAPDSHITHELCPDCRVRAGDDHLPGCTVAGGSVALLVALKLCVIRDPSLSANVMVAEAIAKAEGRS